MQAIGVIGSLVAIAFLIFSVYKGYHIAYMAVICSIIVVVTNQMSFIDTLTSTYITGFANCANVVWYFVFGLIMSEMYGKSGAGKSIARIILKIAGKKNASLFKKRVVGIIAVFVIGVLMLLLGFASNALPFLLLPIVTSIFAECDIPRRFMPGLLLGTAATIGNCLPGTPQSVNQICSTLLGTTGTAALVPGIVGAIVVAAGIVVYMNWAIARASKKGEHFEYGPLPQQSEEESEKKGPNIILALLPLVFIFVAYNFFGLHLYICLLIACVACIFLFWPYYEGGVKQLKSYLGTTMTRAGSMCLVAGSFMGFSAVFQAAPSFEVMMNGLTNMTASSYVLALFLLLLSMGFMAFIAGSAPTALQTGIPIFAPIYEAAGVSAAAIHRVAAFATTTFDTLPTNTGIIFIMDMCGVSMKDGYKTVGVNTVVCTFIGSLVVALLCMIPGLA